MGSGRKSLVAPVLAAVLFVIVLAAGWILVEDLTGQRFSIWIGTIPTLLLFLGVLIVWSLFALIVWWIAERSLAPDSREASQETIYRLILLSSSFFVFVLGFVVSQEWGNINTVRRDVSSGAAALETATYQAEALPKPAREQVRSALNELGFSIACRDLPSLRETGRGAEETALALKLAFRSLTRLPPELRDEAAVGDVVDDIGQISMARRLTLAGAASGLPGVIVVAIFAVAGILLTLFIVQSTRSRKAHLMVTVGLVVLISLGTAMVLSLARPFGGPANIDTAFNDELSQSYIECDRRNMPQSAPRPVAR